MANPYGPNPNRQRSEVVYQEGGKEQKIKVQYIGGLFRGTLEHSLIFLMKNRWDLIQRLFIITLLISRIRS